MLPRMTEPAPQEQMRNFSTQLPRELQERMAIYKARARMSFRQIAEAAIAQYLEREGY